MVVILEFSLEFFRIPAFFLKYCGVQIFFLLSPLVIRCISIFLLSNQRHQTPEHGAQLQPDDVRVGAGQ